MLNSYFKHRHWPLNIDRWSDVTCDWWVHLISSLRLFSIASALSLWLHSSGLIIASFHSSLASLCLSSHPSLLNERETLVCLRMAGSRARGGKMRSEREGRWRQRGGMRKEGERRKHAAWSDCKWSVRKGEFSLEKWLVSVRILWEGNQRTAILGLHISTQQGTNLSRLQVWLLQLLKSYLKQWT